MAQSTLAPPQSPNLLRKVQTYAEHKQGNPWDLIPRPSELGDLRGYRDGAGLHLHLLRGGYTMISSRRGRLLHRLAREVERAGTPGALVDCGVFNGGSTILMSRGAPSREVWAFDSFEGLPEPLALDGPDAPEWVGECLGAEERLREGMARFGRPERLHVVKGWFEDTIPVRKDEIGPIAVLHADGDWYESVKLTLEELYPQVVSGGWVVIDDYGHWIGAQRATDEFRAAIGDATPLRRTDYTGRYWRKP